MVIQLVLFVVLLYVVVNLSLILLVGSYLISFAIVLVLVKKDEEPAYKIAWLLIVVLVPFFGGILYLLFGNKQPSRRLSKRINKEHHLIAEHLKQDESVIKKIKAEDSRMAGCMEYVQRSSRYAVYQDTNVKYYPFGEEMFVDMLAELKKAEKFILMEYYIISDSDMWDQILEVLVAKAESGVDVRLIYDGAGSLNLFSMAYIHKLRTANIKVVAFNPILPLFSLVMNNRDHRKIMVIDGKVVFNGGINISDEYINQNKRLGVWKDTGTRLRGDAVRSFTFMFIEIWNSFCKVEERINHHEAYLDAEHEVKDEGFVQPYGDTPFDDERLGESIYIEILNQARGYVYIFTPYLIISDTMIHAMKMAAKRGVDVRIVTPGKPDYKTIYNVTRSYYRYLTGAGVKIYEYTPGFLHGKSFVCDDEVAVVGTINLDYRSLYLNFECATLFYKSSVIKDVKKDALNTIEESKQIAPRDLKYNFWNEFFDAVLHLFAPLM